MSESPTNRAAAGALGLALWTIGLGACRTPMIEPEDTYSIEIPGGWSGSDANASPQHADPAPWWESFGAASLSAAVDSVLEGNRELSQAWSRLAQAEASARSAGAPRIPTLDLNSSAQYQEIDTRGSAGQNLPLRTGEAYSLGLSLSYEVDLFGRIGATLRSARLEEAATAADAQATALALSGRAADAWFTVVEQSALEDLIREQLRVGEQLLEVTENRFATGSGSVLDVLQQRRQLEGTRAELPRVAGEAERARHSIAVLAGRPPRDPMDGIPRSLPALPDLPALDVPSALLVNRPDVAAAMLRVQRADRNVAASVAARFPRLSLSANYNYDSNEIADLFDRTISSLAGSLVVPLIDGASRRAEVDRQRAGLELAVAALEQALLTALQEVEDALSLERRGAERVAILDVQLGIAVDELAQARRRYVGGVDSYLQVLSAIQNLQALQRQLVTERALVLRARAQLHRALGGAWTRDLDAPTTADTDSAEDAPDALPKEGPTS